MLEAEDVQAILAEADLDASSQVRDAFRRNMNRWIYNMQHVRDFRKASTPSAKIEQYARIAAAAQRLLLAVRDCTDAGTGLAYEFDRLTQHPATPASVAELRAKYPNEDGLVILTAAKLGAVSISSQATETVSTAVKSVALLRMLASNVERQVRARLDPNAPPRKVDDTRLGLVSMAAGTFERLFNIRATTTAGGQWVRFLAALLSRIEKDPVTVDNARSIWLKARKRDKEADPSLELPAFG
jgi:hypothetical protein